MVAMWKATVGGEWECVGAIMWELLCTNMGDVEKGKDAEAKGCDWSGET
jgi:hypothetical protein